MRIFVEMTEQDYEDWKKIKQVLDEKREGMNIDELKEVIRYYKKQDEVVPGRKYGPDYFKVLEKPIWRGERKEKSGESRQFLLASELFKE